MSEHTAENDAAALADLSAAIRDYLTNVTDVSMPSFHATALTRIVADHMTPPTEGCADPSCRGQRCGFPTRPISPVECVCGRDEYEGPGKRFLSHAPGCPRPTPPAETGGAS